MNQADTPLTERVATRVINELRQCAALMDGSKMLETCRTNIAFFAHERTQKLPVAPARAIEMEHFCREERHIGATRVMNTYLNGSSVGAGAASGADACCAAA